MPPLSSGELEAVLEAADPETVAGFVAALEDARGRAVEREGARALLVGEDRELVVVPGDDPARPVDGGADRVVVAGSHLDADAVEGRAVDAASVADALLYAVDRERAGELLRTWFDRELKSFDGSDGTVAAGGSAGAGGPREREDRDAGSDARPGSAGTPPSGDDDVAWGQVPADRPVVAAAAVVLVATVALAAWSGGVVPSVGPAAAGGQSPGPPTVTADAGAGEYDPPENPAFATRRKVGAYQQGTADGVRATRRVPPGANSSVADGRLPPGVSPSGSIDESRLLEAHESVLANRSYRVAVGYREFVNGSQTGVFVQRVAVANATSRRVETLRLGRFRGSTPWLGPSEPRAGVGFRASDARWQSDAVTTRDPVLADLLRYLQYYLSVKSSWVAGVGASGDATAVWLRTRGDSWPGVENATGSVVVTGQGLVTQVRRAYDLPGSPVRAVVTVRVSDVGWASRGDGGRANGSAGGASNGSAGGPANGSAVD